MFVESCAPVFATQAEKLVKWAQERPFWDLSGKIYYNRDVLFEGGIRKTVIYMFMGDKTKCKRWKMRNIFRRESHWVEKKLLGDAGEE